MITKEHNLTLKSVITDRWHGKYYTSQYQLSMLAKAGVLTHIIEPYNQWRNRHTFSHNGFVIADFTMDTSFGFGTQEFELKPEVTNYINNL